MSDKNLLQLPLATTGAGALIYGVQDNQDKAFPASVLQGSEQPQAANLVYAGPAAPPGNYPTFRPLVVNDIPDLSMIYLRSNGGTLVNPTINNGNIVGGTISGATIVADDDKWSLRNALDTTKVIRFNVAPIAAGNTRIFAWPDLDGTVVTNNATQTLTNKVVQLVGSTSSVASFRVPHGVPPSAPVNGDIWTTNAGIYVQVNNATVGPLAAAASSTVTTFNGRQGAVTLTFADVTNALGYTPFNPATDQYVKKTGDNMTGSLNMHGTNSRFFMWDDRLESANLEFVAGLNNPTDGAGVIVNRNTNGLLALYARNGAVQVNIGEEAGWTRFVGGAKLSDQVWTTGRLSVAQGAPAQLPSSGLYAGLDMRASGTAVLWAYNYATNVNTPMTYEASEHVFSGYVRTTNTIRAANTIRSEGSNAGILWLERNNQAREWAWSSFNNQAILSASDANALMSVSTTGICHVVGYYTAVGGFGPGSDPKLKDSSTFRSVDNALDKVYNLNVTYGKYHDWYNSDGKERVFLMADEAMKEYAPELIVKDLIEKDGSKYDGWTADQTIALLVKAVQELKDEVDELKEKLNGR